MTSGKNGQSGDAGTGDNAHGGPGGDAGTVTFFAETLTTGNISLTKQDGEVDFSAEKLIWNGDGAFTITGTPDKVSFGSLTLDGGTVNGSNFTNLMEESFYTQTQDITLGAGGGTFDITDDQTVSRNLIGAGSLTKTGLGTLTLTGKNTYTGGTSVRTGTLQIGDSATAGHLSGGSLSLANGSALNVHLNANNEGTGTTGMTVFNVSGTATSDAASTMRFVVNDTNYATNDTYLGATGNFSTADFNANLVAQVSSGSGIAVATAGTNKVTVKILDVPTTGTVHRYAGDVHQNSTSGDGAFNTVFNVGTGTESKPFASGDTIYLTADANADAMTTLTGDNITLTIQSNSVDTREISMDSNVTAGEGAFLSATGDLTLTLSDVKFTGGKGATGRINPSSGGAIYSAGTLTLTGNATFGGTETDKGNYGRNGGALCADDNTNGNIVLNGNFQFLNNSATYGGAIYANNTAKITGTNTFTGNSAADNGGAIRADTATITGTNTFTENSARFGGAIHTLDTATIAGTNSFTGNLVRDYGGAIYSTANVTLSGAGSKATFSGNKHGALFSGNIIISAGTNNDIYTEGTVTIRDGGTYSFGGGIVTEDDGTLTIGAENQDGAPVVTFESGSVTEVEGNFSLTNGSVANVILNANNKDAMTDGATKFHVGIRATADAASIMRFVLDETVTATGTYTGATGNFSAGTDDTAGFDAGLIAQVASGTGIAVAVADTNGIQINFSEPTGNATVYRYDLNGDLQKSTEGNFDGVFGTNPAASSGDKIILTDDANSTGGTSLTNGISLSIQSNSSSDVRTITNTGGSERFLTVGAGGAETTLYLYGVEFKGGNGNDGGAISGGNDLTLIGNATFTENSAKDRGGAINARNVTVSGSTFTGNEVTSGSGGAIFGMENVTVSGSTFTGNTANGEGGAIYTQVLTLTGTNTFTDNEAKVGGAISSESSITLTGTNTFTGNSATSGGGAISSDGTVMFSGAGSQATFSGNTANGNNDIYIDSPGGIVTIQDGGTYSFGGGFRFGGTGVGGHIFIGAETQDGSPNVTLGSGSITVASTLTLTGTGSTLNVELNANNKVASSSDTTYGTGATVLNIATATGEAGSFLRYVVDSSAAEGDIYLGGVGDFSGIESTIIAQVASGTAAGSIVSVKRNDSGLWLGVDRALGDVVRKNADGEEMNIANTFDAVFADGTGAVASGDSITLLANVDSEKVTNLTDVNSLTIYSSETGAMRTIKNTSTDDGAFLTFNYSDDDNDTTLTLADVQFTGGKGTNNGGAISTTGDLTINGTNAKFTGNTVNNLANDIYAAGSVTLKGDGGIQFDGGIVANGLNLNTGVTFSGNAVNRITGMTTIASNDVTFENATNSFRGGITLAAGVNQTITSTDVTLGTGIRLTYANDEFSTLDLSNVHSLTVQARTNVAIQDVQGNSLGIENFKGTAKEITLISGGWTLSTLDSESYESLAYSVFLGYDSTREGYILRSSVNDISNDIEGNVPAAKKLFDQDFFDVPTEEEARGNVNAATGEIFASAAHVQTQRMTYLSQMLTDRTRNLQTCGTCPLNASQPNLWFSSYGLGGSADMHDNFVGYDYNAWGMMIGAELVRDDLMRLGFFYGYGQSETESLQSELNSNDHTFGAYLQWENPYLGGYSLAMGSFSFSDNEAARWYNDAAFQNTYDSWMGLAYYEKGWETVLGSFAVLNPYISLQYMRYDADDFNDDVLAIRDNTYDSFRTALGFRLTKNFGMLCLTSGLAWRHEWLDENASFTAATERGNAAVFGNGTGRDWAELNLGLQYAFGNFTLSGDYYLFANGDNTLHAGMGTLTWKY
ncbi:MAG: autotransporter-associated beta strand repeat-containing protein [Planctomycetia bacterium]|nr:autotransporter-associated beta strand repeat-containing protein [Planctomycetia bacterium]